MRENRAVLGDWSALHSEGSLPPLPLFCAPLILQVQVISGGELLLGPHVPSTLDVELLSRGIPEKLQEFSSTWSPPLTADQWSCRTLTIEGLGWRHVAADVVIPGLGFVTVTGSGQVTLEVHAPDNIDIFTRASWIEETPLTLKSK